MADIQDDRIQLYIESIVSAKVHGISQQLQQLLIQNEILNNSIEELQLQVSSLEARITALE